VFWTGSNTVGVDELWAYVELRRLAKILRAWNLSVTLGGEPEVELTLAWYGPLAGSLSPSLRKGWASRVADGSQPS
jgi:hypothetical protein